MAFPILPLLLGAGASLGAGQIAGGIRKRMKREEEEEARRLREEEAQYINQQLGQPGYGPASTGLLGRPGQPATGMQGTPEQRQLATSRLLAANLDPNTLRGYGVDIPQILSEVDEARVAKLRAETEKAQAGTKVYSDVKVDDSGKYFGYNIAKGRVEQIPQDDLMTKYKSVQSFDADGNPQIELVAVAPGGGIRDRIRATSGRKKLSKEQAVAVSNAELALADIDVATKILFNENGELNRGDAALAAVGVPWTAGRQARGSIRRAVEIMLRARTGAAAPDQEVENYTEFFSPSIWDTDEQAQQKIQNMNYFHLRILSLLREGVQPGDPALRSVYPEGWQVQQPEGGVTTAQPPTQGPRTRWNLGTQQWEEMVNGQWRPLNQGMLQP